MVTSLAFLSFFLFCLCSGDQAVGGGGVEDRSDMSNVSSTSQYQEIYSEKVLQDIFGSDISGYESKHMEKDNDFLQPNALINLFNEDRELGSGLEDEINDIKSKIMLYIFTSITIRV